LVETGTDNALVICQTSTKTEEQFVRVEIQGRNDDTVNGIVCNYLDDDNYFWTEIENSLDGAIAIILIRLYRMGAGTPELLYSTSVVDELQASQEEVEICFSATSFTVSVGAIAVAYDCDPNIHIGGKKAGLKNGAAFEISYDDFDLENYSGTDGLFLDGTACCGQQCHCIDEEGRHCIPQVLTATFTATGTCAPALDGYTLDLTWNAQTFQWENRADQPPCKETPPYTSFCCIDDGACTGGTGPGDTYRLHTLFAQRDSTNITCSPFSVVFPEVEITCPLPPCYPDIPGGCCPTPVGESGTYQITVTE